MINNKGKKQRVRKTKMDALVKLCISCFNFFLSKNDRSIVPNTLTILPPVLFKSVNELVMYFASSNYTRL